MKMLNIPIEAPQHPEDGGGDIGFPDSRTMTAL
jgi:hypothetical protein